MWLGLSIIIIILTTLFLIAVHEAGHAILARYCGVRIHAIVIGLGRPLFESKHPQRSTWKLALWPFGGSVELCNTRIHSVPPREYHHCFDKKPAWMRIMILSAGAAANLGIAWLALIFYFLLGYPQHPALIQRVTRPSTASTAHIQSGDVILSFADTPVASWQAVGIQLMIHLGERNVAIVVKHTQGNQDIAHLDLSNTAKTRGSILTTLGLQPDFSPQQQQLIAGLSWLNAVQQASHTLGTLIHMYGVMLKQLLVGNLSVLCLLGPVGFFITMINSIQQGVALYLYSFANLSIAIALANILPIPSLDGGSIIYTLIEKIRGKPMSIALEVLLYRLAMTALCVLLVQLLSNDVQHYL